MNSIQETIESLVTNGRGYDFKNDVRGMGSMEGLKRDLQSGRLPSESASYLGTYDPRANVTFGISEYGPWATEGDARLDRHLD